MIVQQSSNRLKSQSHIIPHIYNTSASNNIYKQIEDYCLEKKDICFYNRSMWSLNDYFDGRYHVNLGESWTDYESKTWPKHLFYSQNISHWSHMHYNTTQCTGWMNKKLIIPYLKYPQMLGEIWAAELQYLFQLFVLNNSDHTPAIHQWKYIHHIGIIHCDNKPLFMFHDLLFKPFTSYPLINIEPDLFSATTQCPICFKSIYFCGFNQTGSNLTADREETLPQSIKRHSLSWTMRNWYSTYYQTIWKHNDGDDKYHILILDRLHRRQWLNVNAVITQCNNGSYNFECRVIYAEHMHSAKQILDAVSWSDLFIGVHGAGLVYALFQNENATVLEFLPAKCKNESIGENECISPFFLRHDARGSPIRKVFESTPLRHSWFRLTSEEYVLNGSSKHSLFWGDHNYVVNWLRIYPYIDYLYTHQEHNCGRYAPNDAPNGLFFGRKMDFNYSVIRRALPKRCLLNL